MNFKCLQRFLNEVSNVLSLLLTVVNAISRVHCNANGAGNFKVEIIQRRNIMKQDYMRNFLSCIMPPCQDIFGDSQKKIIDYYFFFFLFKFCDSTYS